MKLCVIPARGGSKRIPRKNIKPFYGKPIIAYSIEAAIKSNCFDLVIVSTDDEEIAEISRQYGAQTPFTRPPQFSDDYIGVIPVIRHAVKWFLDRGKNFQQVCCIYPTAPFINSDDITSGLSILTETNDDYVFSVTNYAFPIQRAIRILESNKVEMFQPKEFNTRSQDLEEAYHDAGQFYWGKASAWLNETSVFSKTSSPIFLPRSRVQDIDNMDDWKHAELIYQASNLL
jgi:N-acylneuraminate cytidylyltransferase